MALADHQPKRKGGHLEHVITPLTGDDREILLGWLHDPSFTAASIAEILTEEGHLAKDYHVTHWRDRNIKGANK